MLVKAVANSTTANFIRVVGSEFVQKYLGESQLSLQGIWFNTDQIFRGGNVIHSRRNSTCYSNC